MHFDTNVEIETHGIVLATYVLVKQIAIELKILRLS